MFCKGKKSGLSKAATAVVIVIVVAAAGLGATFAPPKTTTVTQTVTQSATVTTTVTSLQTPTANNTIDLTANSTVTLAVVGHSSHIGYFLIGTLINPTIKVKAGTSVRIYFYSSAFADIVTHSFVITNSKPPFPASLSQSDVTPAFPGASTDKPIQPERDQFVLSFTADKPGTYYYICAFNPHAKNGMYGQFIVEA